MGRLLVALTGGYGRCRGAFGLDHGLCANRRGVGDSLRAGRGRAPMTTDNPDY